MYPCNFPACWKGIRLRSNRGEPGTYGLDAHDFREAHVQGSALRCSIIGMDILYSPLTGRITKSQPRRRSRSRRNNSSPWNESNDPMNLAAAHAEWAS